MLRALPTRNNAPRGTAFRVGTARRRAHSPVEDGACTPLMAHPTGLFDIVSFEGGEFAVVGVAVAATRVGDSVAISCC
jgi:hypothetical protein